jgi:hypothetical protein
MAILQNSDVGGTLESHKFATLNLRVDKYDKEW